jgi:hypothetical protein
VTPQTRDTQNSNYETHPILVIYIAFFLSDSRKRKGDTVPAPYRHTYVMKLFDRSVDLARFEEDTPLYPICRAWMQNQPRNPQSIVK